jgi:uncharacterized protein
VTPTPLDVLARSRYVLLTSFRRNGAPMATPVWAARRDGELWVWTNPDAGKVKRIRRNPQVLLQPCSVRGVPVGDPVSGQARVVPPAESAEIFDVLIRKYGWQARMSRLGDRLAPLIGRPSRPPGALVIRVG